MLDLQRNLFLEGLCELRVVVHAPARVFRLLGLGLGSLEGVEGLAGSYNLQSFLGLVVILYRVKLTAFLLEWGLIRCICVRWGYWQRVVDEVGVDEPPEGILEVKSLPGEGSVGWVEYRIIQLICL